MCLISSLGQPTGGGAPAWELGDGLFLHPERKQLVTKCQERPRIWTGCLERSRQRKMDIKFGIWNVLESLCDRFTENSSKRIGKV